VFLTKHPVEAGEEAASQPVQLNHPNNHSHPVAQGCQDKRAVFDANGDDAKEYPKAERFRKEPWAPRLTGLEEAEPAALQADVGAESTGLPLLQQPVPH
jgi:hypothetical protein